MKQKYQSKTFKSYLKEKIIKEKFPLAFYQQNKNRTGKPFLDNGKEVNNTVVLDDKAEWIAILDNGNIIFTNTEHGDELVIPAKAVSNLKYLNKK